MSEINPSRTRSNVRPGWPRVQVPAYFSEYRAALDGRSRPEVAPRSISSPTDASTDTGSLNGSQGHTAACGHPTITEASRGGQLISTGCLDCGPVCACHHTHQQHDRFGFCSDCCCAHDTTTEPS